MAAKRPTSHNHIPSYICNHENNVFFFVIELTNSFGPPNLKTPLTTTFYDTQKLLRRFWLQISDTNQ